MMLMSYVDELSRVMQLDSERDVGSRSIATTAGNIKSELSSCIASRVMVVDRGSREISFMGSERQRARSLAETIRSGDYVADNKGDNPSMQTDYTWLT